MDPLIQELSKEFLEDISKKALPEQNYYWTFKKRVSYTDEQVHRGVEVGKILIKGNVFAVLLKLNTYFKKYNVEFIECEFRRFLLISKVFNKELFNNVFKTNEKFFLEFILFIKENDDYWISRLNDEEITIL